MTDEQLAEIKARLAAVPDTELRALSNDPFNSELTICKVMPLETDGPIRSTIVGDVAYLTEAEEALNYATLFVFARPDISALIAEVERLTAESAALRTDAELGHLVHNVLPRQRVSLEFDAVGLLYAPYMKMWLVAPCSSEDIEGNLMELAAWNEPEQALRKAAHDNG